MTQSIIETATVRLDADLGHSKDEVIRGLASTLVDAGRATDLDQMVTALGEREAKSPTGMPGGIAIPHCKSDAVATPSLGFARLATPVDFGAKDGPADLVFLIGAPGGGGKEHLKVLSTLARNLVRKDFVAALRSAATAEEAVEIIDAALAPTPKAESAPEDKAHTGSRAATAAGAAGAGAAAATAEGRADHETTGATTDAATPLRVVAVTACPTGIAHTYMAADSLTQVADERDDVELVVETQGSSAVKPVPAETIAAADAVIFATDVGVKDRGRFAGKPVVESGVKRAINEPAVMVDEAIAAGSPTALHATERIDRATGRGQQLIDELLAYSRSGQTEFTAVRVDLDVLFRHAVEDVRARVDRDFDVVIGPLFAAAGEEGLLRQVVDNLLYNAVHYCPPDRRPRIVVDAVTVPSRREGIVRVTDNGLGIPVEERESVFAMFQRGRSTGGAGGTGIGLALCRRVLERHGGSIRIEDGPHGPLARLEREDGTTFDLPLRVLPGALREGDLLDVQDGPDGVTVRILVAETMERRETAQARLEALNNAESDLREEDGEITV